MPQNNLIALWFPVASILIGLAGLLYAPSLILNIQDSVTRSNSLTQEATTLDGKIVQLESAEEKYQALQDSVARVETAIPSDKDYPTVLSELEGIAVVSGIVLREVNFSELKRGRQGESVLPKGIDGYFINIELTGSYGAFRAFVHQLEGELRISDIQSIDLSRQQGRLGTAFNLGSELSNNNYSLQVLTYFQAS